MSRDQSFPVSVEVQLLGGLDDGTARPTANVCTPGTDVVYRDRIQPEHCLNARAPTIDGEAWVRVEVLVLGGGTITHWVDGEQVLTYGIPQIGGPGAEALTPRRDGELLVGGYIALQSESHPVQFRRVELLDLSGCTDPAASNYRDYVVRSRPGSCEYDAETDPAPGSKTPRPTEDG